MKHELVMEGPRYRLRPVTIEDAEFIVNLRTMPVRERYIHVTSPDVGLQAAWLQDYFAREGDYYFIIERRSTNAREGTIGIYNIDKITGWGELGRWVTLPESTAAIAGHFLAMRVAFQSLSLNGLYTRTADANTAVIAILEKSGLTQTTLIPGAITIGDRVYTAVRQEISREAWLARRDRQ